MTLLTSQIAFVLLAIGGTLGGLVTRADKAPIMKTQTVADQRYVGMWATKDNHVRHELLPNGRYVEARGTKEKAYEGRYWLEGDHIEYKDDTGFTADGDFIDDVLHHGGMILYRQKK